jgi:hypothetical protein
MWLVYAVLCFALSVALHAVASRIRLDMNRVVSYALVASVAGLVLVWALIGHYGADVRAWAALFMYALAVELYVFLFTMVGSSITARILITLRTRDLTLEELNSVFSTTGMVEGRMVNLLDNGYIQPDGPAGYSLTPRGWLMVRAFRSLRNFFRRGLPT